MEYHNLWKRWLFSNGRTIVSWKPNSPVIVVVESIPISDWAFTIDQRNGDVIVSDGYAVRRIRDQKSAIIAGSDAEGGWIDGNGIVARFHGISDLCAAQSGVIYLADEHNARIRCLKADNESDPNSTSYSITTFEQATWHGMIHQIVIFPTMSAAESESTLFMACHDRYDNTTIHVVDIRSGNTCAEICHVGFLRVLPISDTKLIMMGRRAPDIYDWNTRFHTLVRKTRWMCAAIDPKNGRDVYAVTNNGQIWMLPKFLPL